MPESGTRIFSRLTGFIEVARVLHVGASDPRRTRWVWPQCRPRRVGLVTVGAIVLILAVFLLITWLSGDPTNGLKERQPTPSPESPSTS
jgi:hypothetical protein